MPQVTHLSKDQMQAQARHRRSNIEFGIGGNTYKGDI